MNPSATIVLPVYNGERTLREDIEAILAVAQCEVEQIQLVIVDDGSTDETYETACELASRYPQIRVIRQPFQRGLAAALDRVRRHCAAAEVIAHDGVGPIDLEELAAMLREPAGALRDAGSETRGSRRFAAVSSLNARMQAAHRSVLGFRRLSIAPGIQPRRRTTTSIPLVGGQVAGLIESPICQS